jgi:hypothetical protein
MYFWGLLIRWWNPKASYCYTSHMTLNISINFFIYIFPCENGRGHVIYAWWRYDKFQCILSSCVLFCAALLGLKQALATVNDYNPLMKDFPINDLLSATELDRIRSAVQLIFSHLRKIRSTKYPIQRALRLVEAISRDLGSQLLKVSVCCSISPGFVYC